MHSQQNGLPLMFVQRGKFLGELRARGLPGFFGHGRSPGRQRQIEIVLRIDLGVGDGVVAAEIPELRTDFLTFAADDIGQLAFPLFEAGQQFKEREDF